MTWCWHVLHDAADTIFFKLPLVLVGFTDSNKSEIERERHDGNTAANLLGSAGYIKLGLVMCSLLTLNWSWHRIPSSGFVILTVKSFMLYVYTQLPLNALSVTITLMVHILKSVQLTAW